MPVLALVRVTVVVLALHYSHGCYTRYILNYNPSLKLTYTETCIPGRLIIHTAH